MTGQAAFSLRGRNPDVLTCIANLSNDEVFTPPEFAGKMLDTLADSHRQNISPVGEGQQPSQDRRGAVAGHWVMASR